MTPISLILWTLVALKAEGQEQEIAAGVDRAPTAVKSMRLVEAEDADDHPDQEDLNPPRDHRFNVGFDLAHLILPMVQLRPFGQMRLTDHFGIGLSPIFWIFIDPTSQITNIANRPRTFFFGLEVRGTYFFSGDGLSTGFRLDAGPELIFLPQPLPSLVSSQPLFEVFFYYGGFVTAGYQYFFDNGFNVSLSAGAIFKRMTDYQFTFYQQLAGPVDGRLEVRLGFSL